jgi:hypothetical protein
MDWHRSEFHHRLKLYGGQYPHHVRKVGRLRCDDLGTPNRTTGRSWLGRCGEHSPQRFSDGNASYSDSSIAWKRRWRACRTISVQLHADVVRGGCISVISYWHIC